MLDLFPSGFDREGIAKRLRSLIERNVYVGTSSWKYAGWLGQLYDRSRYEVKGRFSDKRFQSECLEEYGQFLPTVCVDAGYYKFPDDRYIEGLVRRVPASFRFSFKVTDTITLRRFPNLDRFGPQRARWNPDFLNVAKFEREFLKPFEPYRERIGALIFEFAEFRQPDFRGPDEFLQMLDRFLGQLPTGWQYAAELRTKEYLTSGYLEILRSRGVAHVFNQWARMPDANEQLKMRGTITADFVVGRFLLKQGRSYEDAVKLFEPYDKVREVNETARQAAQTLIWDIPSKEGRPSFVYLNNRLEGNALSTIDAITRRMA
jgi:uncharacterized protein YecE (DUF72 family)